MPVKLLLIDLTVKQLDPMLMPQDPGSMLRGAFGHALKALSEQVQSQANHDKPIPNAYYTIFEQPKDLGRPQHSTQSNNKSKPALASSVNNRSAQGHTINPYVLKLPNIKNARINSNQNWTFSQLLIGERAIECAPIIIKAWAQALQQGIGSTHKRHRVMLQTVIANDTVLYQHGQLLDFVPKQLIASPLLKGRAVYEQLISQYKANHLITNHQIDSAKDNDSVLTLTFITPFRAQQKGKVAHTAAQLDIKQLLYSLYNRIQHCLQLDHINSQDNSKNLKLGFSDFYDFKNTVDKLTCDSKLTPYRISRHSSRQKRNMTLFGLTGSISLKASTSVLARLLPVLRLGEYIHIGKNSTLGLGQYRITLDSIA